MGAAGYLTRRFRPGPAAAGPDGPAVATLHTVAGQTAALVRSIGLGYVLVQVIIWREFFAAHPARLIGPLVAVSSAALVVTALARGEIRGPAESHLRITADSAVCVLLGLVAGPCVPPEMRGDTASWLYIALVVQVIVPAWFAPARLAGPLALASAAAFWAGVQLTGAAAGTSPAAAAAFLVSVAVAVWWGFQVLYRRAARADAALARADQESREQYVLLSRSAERREHERVLHDTVLNTLTGLARPGSAPAADVVGQCWRDVTLVEHLLGAAGGPAEAGHQPLGDLRISLAAVAGELRSRGLVVHAGAVPGGADGPELPVPVSAALAQAVREALANVLSHAGTGEAWLDISAHPGPPAGLRITVRDAGAGFAPDQVDPSRLGLRRSIIERIADCGGQAAVRSAPGQGTTVSLCWPC
jgi:signal transduction histidine kinase